jgi:hypothetical protein
MCGSRTGGWSLPCVMSDWQRCVDWFLAKYCRCGLRLDSCWCRWRTSMKGRGRWGLQVWRRQVGFFWETRWPAESSAGRMVAWTAREVMDGFLVEPQNQGRGGTTWEPSHEWRLVEATLSSRGFRWFTWKPLGSLVDLRKFVERFSWVFATERPVQTPVRFLLGWTFGCVRCCPVLLLFRVWVSLKLGRPVW